ncbi:hypothetical protein F5Y19DRAFT_95872 [Xylariaceae sp. FL1651]|nr:hypothetical protein F5Y19DRAFT_95872 [Xylariaceae sp. FL1651]
MLPTTPSIALDVAPTTFGGNLPPASYRIDMESLQAAGKQPSAFHEPHHVLLDSFRWLDDDDDLDLRLTLDDYPADLMSPKPLPDPGQPSLFRRRLSVSKLPFGRSSVSSSRPATKDSSPPDQAPYGPHHVRRKSRALSLITLKHDKQASVAPIDPAAAHYQDPEARLKLRVYLASPQKFDEALQFGFPSNDVCPVVPPGHVPSNRSCSNGLLTADSDRLMTFLADDHSSIYSDEFSDPDPESPRTPDTPEKRHQGIKSPQPPSRSTTLPSKLSEGDAQVPTVSREMTLRMTLTRPDLRSCQEELYGWRRGQADRSSRSPPFRAATPVSASETREATKESIERIFAGIDQEMSLPSDGVVRRFWNRVRRS